MTAVACALGACFLTGTLGALTATASTGVAAVGQDLPAVPGASGPTAPASAVSAAERMRPPAARGGPPARVRVPALGIDAPVDPVVVNGEGALAVPDDVHRLGWWSAGPAPGAGAGTVSFDVALTGVDAKGKSIDFGSTTVSGDITPGENVILVPFELTVPGTAVGAPIKSLALSVLQHGANLGFSAKHLDGDSYLVLPTKKK